MAGSAGPGASNGPIGAVLGLPIRFHRRNLAQLRLAGQTALAVLDRLGDRPDAAVVLEPPLALGAGSGTPDVIRIAESSLGEPDSEGAVKLRAAPSEPVELAIEGYDQLAAAQIISLLDELEPDELDALDIHERSGRKRRTILARLAALRAQQ